MTEEAIMTEDTPEADSVEMLQWKVAKLVEQCERDAAEIERLMRVNYDLRIRNEKAEAGYDRLTVGVLRAAGAEVEITWYEDDD